MANMTALKTPAKPMTKRLRKRLVEHGLEAAMDHGNRGSYRAKKLDGVAEAHLIATACSSAPHGRNRWTVRLLAEEMVSLGIVAALSKAEEIDTKGFKAG